MTLPYYLHKINIIQDPSNRWQYYDASVENTDNIKEVDNYFEEHSEIIEEFVERDEEEEYDEESKLEQKCSIMNDNYDHVFWLAKQ